MYMKNYFVKYLIFFKKLIHQLYLDAVDTLSWSRCGWNAQYWFGVSVDDKPSAILSS